MSVAFPVKSFEYTLNYVNEQLKQLSNKDLDSVTKQKKIVGAISKLSRFILANSDQIQTPDQLEARINAIEKFNNIIEEIRKAKIENPDIRQANDGIAKFSREIVPKIRERVELPNPPGGISEHVTLKSAAASSASASSRAQAKADSSKKDIRKP